MFAETFIKEMRNVLYMDDDYVITTNVRTDELGLDSLVTVRIRSWFLNHDQVNFPALKIIKGISFQKLIDQTLDNMPGELTPNSKTIDSSIDHA